MLIGDFNVALTEANMAAFCNEYRFLSKQPSCFKDCMSLSCIDLCLRNCPKSIESTLTIETYLSGFHRLTVTVVKVKHENISPKIIQYI